MPPAQLAQSSKLTGATSEQTKKALNSIDSVLEENGIKVNGNKKPLGFIETVKNV